MRRTRRASPSGRGGVAAVPSQALSRAPAPEWLASFCDVADPAHYVARPETGRVLSELLRCVDRPGMPVALTAAPGAGKTLLLRLLAERAPPGLHSVFLPYAAVDPEDFSAWVLGRLPEVDGLAGLVVSQGPTGAGLDGLEALAEALHLQQQGLLLLVDDAGGMPPETARALGGLVAQSNGAVRLVLATCDDSRGDRVIAALGGAIRRIRLRAAMTLQETATHVVCLLEKSGAPEPVMQRATAERLGRIHRESGGVPRLVRRMAAWELADLPPGVRVPWGEDGLLDLVDARPADDPEDDLDDLGEVLSAELPGLLSEHARSRR